MIIFSKKNKKKQIQAIFDWLSGIAKQKDLILVNENSRHRAYIFEFPLKYGDKPKRIKKFNAGEVSFLIKLNKLSLRQVGAVKYINKKEWLPVFRLPELEIYERRERTENSVFRPLYLGLSEEAKKIAFEISRHSLDSFLREKKEIRIQDIVKELCFPLPPVFSSMCDLSIALWLDGVLRGSWTVKDRTLGEGLISASVLACRNSRFKPLEAEELAETRIEISLISDLKIPVDGFLQDRREIIRDKGCLVKRAGREKWVLPEAFSSVPSRSPEDPLFMPAPSGDLSQSPRDLNNKAEFFISEVDDFIEREKNGGVFDLGGPAAPTKDENVDIKEVAFLAAGWLLKVQEPDGNFIPIINPVSGRKSRIDWSRSALSSWGLVEFGKIMKRLDYIEAGKKNFFYLKKYFLEDPIIFDNADHSAMALIFLGELASSLGFNQDAEQCASGLLRKEFPEFSVITLLQAGIFLAHFPGYDKKNLELILRIFDATGKKFEENSKNNIPMSLPTWAGLLELSLKIYGITDNIFYLQFTKKIIDWLLSNQLSNGSFRSSTDSDFAYARGTGKVCEMLACIFSVKNNKKIDDAMDISYYKRCLKDAFKWLGKMQYSAENSYCVPKEHLELVIGGFRHDNFNSDLWIDSVGHLLLSASRFLKS